MHEDLQQRRAQVGPTGVASRARASHAAAGPAGSGPVDALQRRQQAADSSPRVARLRTQAGALQHRPAATGQPVVQRLGWEDIGSTLWSWGANAASWAAANPWVSVPLGLLTAGGLAYAYSRSGSGLKRRPGQLDAADLPADQLWRTYINPKDFQAAEELDDPGLIYDRDTSPGFQASMLRAVRQELTFSGGHIGRRVDWAEYERLHDLVSGGLTQGGGLGRLDTKETARAPSSGHRIWLVDGSFTGVDPGSNDFTTLPQVAFPVNDWDDEDTPLARDLLDETVGGIPLIGPRSGTLDQSVASYDKGNLYLQYSLGQGQVLTQQILDRYYQEVGQAETSEDKLRAIVKAIRAIHVTHAFRDANGRLNVNILLNKFLLEQGFDPTILPREGLGIFGGGFSVDQLVRAVGRGSEHFREVAESKKTK